MDPHSTYRHSYPNKRLDSAYRKFVRGEASLRQLQKSSQVSLRTLQRYSSQDQWVEELEQMKARASAAASLMTQMAAMAPDVASGGATGDTTVTLDGAKEIILGVLKRQQQWWDRIESHVIRALEEMERKAGEAGKPLVIGQLLGLLNAAEKASSNVRKAYGIPDVTKLEFEDKTPTAKKHADVIRDKRQARLAAGIPAAAAIQKEQVM